MRSQYSSISLYVSDYPLWNMNNSKMVTVYVTKIKRWTEIMSKIKRKINKKPENNMVDQSGKKTST